MLEERRPADNIRIQVVQSSMVGDWWSTEYHRWRNIPDGCLERRWPDEAVQWIDKKVRESVSRKMSVSK